MVSIVVIDDEPVVCDTITEMLQKAGHDVRSASDGNVGIKLCQEQPPHIVITDIIMPEKEGIETIRELTKDYPDIRIIAISGGGRIDNTDLLRIAGHFGAHKILEKPFSRADLLEAVDDLL
ncbi:MAG: response regulator [Rhodospirillaceae bacterium]|jgi:CheY-like chemotaxis protein|nr:response regulator [Rhodospirillaceae bacterium]MBT5374587.1 response regulator [Rhodospirillaceae bacterium]MBT5659900.1 response regulator [Rhodospirillaceae bacterium]MBT5752715.1 response regulator [Rhodospirillaceae bacterium]